jgi:arylsulfatase A-like enzyme
MVFVADQMRADHLGCAGNPVVRTPNLDALAARGVRFDRAYVANPLCQPARATLFTGLTPRGHGVRTNGIPLDDRLPLLPDQLRKAGYRTHSVGKLHLRNYGEAPPTAAEAACERYAESRHAWADGRVRSLPAGYGGFETADFTGGHGAWIFGDYVNWLRGRDPGAPELLGPRAGTPPASGAPESWTMALPAELHYNTWVADRAIDFLSGQAGSEQPFFLWCSFPDPHHPYCPPEPWASLYRDAEVPPPTRLEDELDDLPPHYWSAFTEDVRLAGRFGPTRIADDQLRDIVRLTYGMVSMVDHNVGRVVAELDRLGLRDDTVVIFLSDHGDMLGDHWMLNKGPFHFDGLIRVPMIWSWPTRWATGAVCSSLVSHLDFAPTLLELAGVPVPEGPSPPDPVAAAQLPPWPGASIGELLVDPTGRVHDQLLVENDEDYLGLRLRTLVTDRYQITVYPGQEYGELFDLAEDPGQLCNLWCSPAHAAVKTELRLRLLDEIVRTDNTLPRRMVHA